MIEHDRNTVYVNFQDVVQYHETLADALEQVCFFKLFKK